MLSLVRSTRRAVCCISMMSARHLNHTATSSFIRPITLQHAQSIQYGRGFLVKVPTLRYCTGINSGYDIGTEELLDMIEAKDIQLIDVREPWELIERGQIPSAVNIPLGEVAEAFSLPSDQFHQKYGVPKPGLADENLVFFCRAGIRSKDAMFMAIDLGYSRAKNYLPGILGWHEHHGTDNGEG